MAYASATRPARPWVIGHRGSPREHRENTIPSFARAFDAGAEAIELDVHGTADGAVVIHHDAATNSRPGDSGPRVVIAETTLSALREIRIANGPIPTLAEVLCLTPEDRAVFVEVKAKGIEAAVVSVIRAAAKQCAVHSFDHRVARRVREVAPEIPVGILQTSYPVDPLRPMHDADARDLWQHWELIDRDLVDGVHADGGRVIAWTVNDGDAARRLARWGVDGICTDVPAAMRALVDEAVG
ncbi:MAG TPA: glycerophosphodiester phosphodiesterase [Gemmatimonadaceae bacterium]|nr:glycerophosphodiester phosphodiesterase [Gemmatimonadaceae bacterium]